MKPAELEIEGLFFCFLRTSDPLYESTCCVNLYYMIEFAAASKAGTSRNPEVLEHSRLLVS